MKVFQVLKNFWSNSFAKKQSLHCLFKTLEKQIRSSRTITFDFILQQWWKCSLIVCFCKESYELCLIRATVWKSRQNGGSSSKSSSRIQRLHSSVVTFFVLAAKKGTFSLLLQLSFNLNFDFHLTEDQLFRRLSGNYNCAGNYKVTIMIELRRLWWWDLTQTHTHSETLKTQCDQ